MGLSYCERLAVFIDGPSLQRATKALRLDMDYKRLLMLFQQRGHLVRAHYYAALSTDRSECTIRPLLDWLSYNGFAVVTKTAKDVAGSGAQTTLGVEIAVDAMQMVESIDHFVFFSGSGELMRLFEALQWRGRQVTVVSTLRSEAPVADELRRQADHFLDLEELRPILSRETRGSLNGTGAHQELP